MLKMFTWSQYLIAVAILLVLYYAYVAAVYYRQELQELLTRKRLVDPSPVPRITIQRGPLITAAATTLIPSVETPADEAPEAQSTEEDSAEVKAGPEADDESAPASDEASGAKEMSNDINDRIIESNEKSTKFTRDAQAAAPESGVEEFEQDFTVGVAQLNDYLGRAADGEITREQLVQEMPALDNTALLAAFYKTTNQNSQQMAAALFADMPGE